MAGDVSIMKCPMLFFGLSCLFLLGTVICDSGEKLVSKSIYFDEDTYYFEVLEPEVISYLYKIRQSRGFGVHINQTYNYVPLAIAEPIDGCGAAVSLDKKLSGAVAFVERGGCSFLSKALNVEEAGAVAVIIADSDHGNDDKMVDMIEDGTGRVAHIPAFFLLGKDGYMIHQTLTDLGLSSAVINIPVNVTGLHLHHINQPPWSLW